MAKIPASKVLTYIAYLLKQREKEEGWPLHRRVRLGEKVREPEFHKNGIVMGIVQELDSTRVDVQLHIDGTRQTIPAEAFDADWELSDGNDYPRPDDTGAM